MELVNVWEQGVCDPERFMCIDRLQGEQCAIRFFDVVLPEDEQNFLAVRCDEYMLLQVVAAHPCDIINDDARCVFLTEGDLLKMYFYGPGFLLANEWTVKRADFVRAVAEFQASTT